MSRLKGCCCHAALLAIGPWLASEAFAAGLELADLLLQKYVNVVMYE